MDTLRKSKGQVVYERSHGRPQWHALAPSQQLYWESYALHPDLLDMSDLKSERDTNPGGWRPCWETPEGCVVREK